MTAWMRIRPLSSLPDYSPQLKEFNMGIAKELIKEGGKVTCRAKSGDEKAAAYLVSDLV